MAARVLIIIFLLSLPASSQAPNDGSAEMKMAIPGRDGGVTVTNPTTARLPEAPKPQRVIDGKFVIVMSALGAAESLRFTTRQLVVAHEFDAGAPWVRNVPSDPDLVGKHLLIFAAELAVTYELKKPHSWLPGDKYIRKLWWAYPAAMGAIHVKNGIGNIRTQGPAGCASIECAAQMQ
ncbi:MAG TPA: hypothetical protein VND65_12260 [Candidatus Binatia bacterium]|nr:hypothetical protein [Candidatus Binatia bacterium]